MKFYQDQIVKMIRNKFANRIMDAVRDCDIVTLTSKRPDVRVPLLAGADVVFDEGFGDIILKAEIKVDGNNLGGSCIYSTRSIVEASDAAEIIHHICEELKKSMLHSLAKKEFERLLK